MTIERHQKYSVGQKNTIICLQASFVDFYSYLDLFCKKQLTSTLIKLINF